jgi:hypothetical protein
MRTSILAAPVPKRASTAGPPPAGVVFWDFSWAWSAGRGDLVRPRCVLWNDIFVSSTD